MDNWERSLFDTEMCGSAAVASYEGSECAHGLSRSLPNSSSDIILLLCCMCTLYVCAFLHVCEVCLRMEVSGQPS